MKSNFAALLSLLVVHTIHCHLELQSLEVAKDGLAEIGASLISGKAIAFIIKSETYFYGRPEYLNVTLFKSQGEKLLKRVMIDQWYFSDTKLSISPTLLVKIQFGVVNIYSPENNNRAVLADGEDHFVVDGDFKYLYQSGPLTKMKFENNYGNSPYTCDPFITNGYSHSDQVEMSRQGGFQSELNQVLISGNLNFNRQYESEYLHGLRCLYSFKWSVSAHPSYYGITRPASIIHTKAFDDGFQILFSNSWNKIHSIMMFPYESSGNYKKNAFDQETGITKIRSDARTLDHYLAMLNTAKACWVSTWWEGGDVKSSVSCQQLP